MPIDPAIRILVADDHRIVRDGLRLILESQEEFTLAGEAADGEEAVRLAAELRPDVILMDLRMPRMDGIAAIEEIRKQDSKAGIVILTTYNEDNLMVRGLRAGALGFLLKDTDRETLFRVIRAAARGESLLQPETLARVLSRSEKPTVVQAKPSLSSGKPADFPARCLPIANWRCCELWLRASAPKRSPSTWGSPSAPSRLTWRAYTTSWGWIRAPQRSRSPRKKAGYRANSAFYRCL